MKKTYLLAFGAVLACFALYYWTAPKELSSRVARPQVESSEVVSLEDSSRQEKRSGEQEVAVPVMQPPPKEVSSSIKPVSRRIAGDASEYFAITNPVERMLTATTAKDAEWMARNLWPTNEEVLSLIPTRDCVPQGDIDPMIETDLRRANACVARFFLDKDSRFDEAVRQATSRGSSLASNLEFERELGNLASAHSTNRLVEIALQSAILGDNTALEIAVRERWNPLPLNRVNIVVALTLPTRDIFVRREAAGNASLRPPRPREFTAQAPATP